MAETPSTMMPLGTVAPDFTLVDSISNKTLSLSDLKSTKATVIVFMCNHCPYVKLILPKLLETARTYIAKGIHFIAINSNDAETYPSDAPPMMRQEAERLQFPFPYLFDETQEIARAYAAACTPDFYIFDGDLKCVYRGRFDEATPGNKKPVTGADLSAALDSILANKPLTNKQHASLGCSIKWKNS